MCQVEMKENHESEDEKSQENEKSNLKGDYGNVAILLFLYFLQGVPLGVSFTVPILLQNRGVTYAEQAIFSLAFYPFTLKILWAPLVDSIYIRRFGRRKTWLIPSQILIGAFMIYLSRNVNDWMGDGAEKKPEMILLTSGFFTLWFLTATQDIAVDGWALTMLQRRNVAHAATCNAVGNTAGGYLTGYIVFLVLESKDFCNKYIFHEPKDEGLVNLSSFLAFWGVVFLISTLLIGIFKHESSENEALIENNPEYSIKKAYPLLWKIVRLEPIMKFAIILTTVKISFVACDAITTLKLMDYGIPKEKVAFLSLPLLPFQILLPFVISKYTTGPYPMTFYIKAFPYRLIWTIVIAVFVYFTPSMISHQLNDIPTYYYVAIVSVYLVYQIPLKAMYVADMAFMARISDPLVGASYMTLINTLSNLGGRCVRTFFLWLADIMTWRSCVVDDFSSFNSTMILTIQDNKCADKNSKEICKNFGGKCVIDIDGYYIEVALNVIYGICWYFWGRKMIEYLQKLPISDWHVLSKHVVESDTTLPTLPLNKST